MKVPTLGEMRLFLGQTVPVSVCMVETPQYENYAFLSKVPHEYDPLYIYGIGLVESEFYVGEDGLIGCAPEEVLNEPSSSRPNLTFKSTLELMLSKEPRDVPDQKDKEESAEEGGESERSYAQTLYELDGEMIRYREALKDKNSPEYQQHLKAEEAFNTHLSFLD